MNVLAAGAIEAPARHKRAIALRRPSENDHGLHKRIPDRVKYVDHPFFGEEDVEEQLFGRDAQTISVPRWRHFSQLPDEGWHPRAARSSLTPDDQAYLFLRYNYAKRRLSNLLAGESNGDDEVRVTEMVAWYRRVLDGRSDLVEANMALVVAMAKRTRIPNVDFEDLISEGSLALLRSIETFDLRRGFKLSTYACRSILKSFNRLATKTGRYRQRFAVEFDPDLERSDYDERKHEIQRDNSVDDLREILARNRAKLSDMELAVVMERFAIGLEGKGRTLRDVGQLVGVTAERVRQIQQFALLKLRRAMSERPT